MLGCLFLVIVNQALPFRSHLNHSAVVNGRRLRQAIRLSLAAQIPVQEVNAGATEQDADNGDNGQNELVFCALTIVVALATVAASALARARRITVIAALLTRA